MAKNNSLYRKWKLPFLTLLFSLGFINGLYAQVNLDKLNKSLKDATSLLNSTSLLVNAAKRTSAEFGKSVKVVKGDKSDGAANIPNENITKPKIKKGEFTNLKWEPVTYFEGQLFPSTIISMATYKGKIQGELEAISRPIGFRIISNKDNIPLRWEIECVDKKYFDKQSGAVLYGQAGTEIYLMPEIPWQYDALSKQLASTPLNFYFRLYDEDGNKVEKLMAVLLRSVNDCIYQYKDIDMGFLFTAFIQEEHPEIDKILKEALNTKMISAIAGYQVNEEYTHKQVAAIWRVLHDRGFKYSSITPTAGTGTNIYSQAVRTFDNALKTSQANCVDGTIVFASILRKIGISSVLVLVPGHCFLGYYTDKTKKNIAYLETTLLSESTLIDKAKTPAEKTKAYMGQFQYALKSGLETYKKLTPKDIRLIDVDYYRQFVKPIPF
ncbi:MAG: hypothetical protein ABIN01_13460 [Ferruginibacter sp.]